jgi:hypothetical protein
VDDVLVAEWLHDEKPLHPVAYSVGGYHGPILPRARARDEALPALLAKLGTHAEGVEAAFLPMPEIEHAAEYDGRPASARSDASASASPSTTPTSTPPDAFGCLLELGGVNGRDHRYVTDAEWLADRLVQKIAAHVEADEERTRARVRHPAVRSRAATTQRRRPAASTGSGTTRRGCPPAAATSTLARRSPSGNRSSTPTR